MFGHAKKQIGSFNWKQDALLPAIPLSVFVVTVFLLTGCLAGNADLPFSTTSNATLGGSFPQFVYAPPMQQNCPGNGGGGNSVPLVVAGGSPPYNFSVVPSNAGVVNTSFENFEPASGYSGSVTLTATDQNKNSANYNFTLTTSGCGSGGSGSGYNQGPTVGSNPGDLSSAYGANGESIVNSGVVAPSGTSIANNGSNAWAVSGSYSGINVVGVSPAGAVSSVNLSIVNTSSITVAGAVLNSTNQLVVFGTAYISTPTPGTYAFLARFNTLPSLTADTSLGGVGYLVDTTFPLYSSMNSSINTVGGALDSLGNLFVTTISSSYMNVVRKYSPDFSLLWTTNLGSSIGSGNNYPVINPAIDPSNGDIWTAWSTNSNVSSSQAQVFRLDSAGNLKGNTAYSGPYATGLVPTGIIANAGYAQVFSGIFTNTFASALYLTRIKSDFSLSASIVINNFTQLKALTIDPSGRAIAVLSYSSNSNSVLARFLSDASAVDSSFNGGVSAIGFPLFNSPGSFGISAGSMDINLAASLNSQINTNLVMGFAQYVQ